MMQVENTSGLIPVGHAVLVRYLDDAVAPKESLIHIPESVRERHLMLEQKAVVVEVGRMAWSEEGEPRAQAGDIVMISKMAGIQAKGPGDGLSYRFINDRDVFAIVKE